MGTNYDEVLYPSAVYSYTHPDLLAAVAVLSGMKPTAVERCRVLELGCGDGLNLISMAHGLPGSEFVGIDLAVQPIAKGQAMIERLGLTNISLHSQDVTMAGPDLGKFDYIIAHGLYSWVPAEVREKMMQICSEQLTANGIAYISYNAFPGNHFRDTVRGMMRFHAAHFSDPMDQIRQARGLVKLIAEAGEESDPYRKVLLRELDRITKYTDSGFFHDDLSAINQPFYFHEFMAHAQRHGLQYLGEPDFTEKQEVPCAPQVQAVLKQLDPKDIIGGEQYRDFVRCRAFRRTLLCRQGIPLDHGLRREAMSDLWISGEIRSTTPEANVATDLPEMFLGNKKSEFETERPVVKAAFRRVGAVWPSRVHFRELLAQIRSDLGRVGEEGLEADTQELAGAMLQTAIAGGVELQAYSPPCILEPGEKPAASTLARIQIEFGSRVSTVTHAIVQIDDALSRLLLTLLDGSRNRRELCEALQEEVRAGRVQGVGVAAEQITEAELDKVLRRLAKMGLLLA